MLLLFTPAVTAIFSYLTKFLSDKPEIINCHEKNGTSVFKVFVQLDSGASLALSGGQPSLKTITKFFGSLFDEINHELQPFGVQLHGNFAELQTTFPYDLTKCTEGNPAVVRSLVASNTLLQKHPKGYGIRLVIFFCPNLSTPFLFGKAAFGCSGVAGFVFGETVTLRSIIKRELVNAIFGTNVRGPTFNKSVCSKVRKCITKNDSILGRYVGDLKSVRHVSDGEFILNDGERLNEHDLYDDFYTKKYISQ